MVTFRPYQRSDRPWVLKANSHFYQSFHNFDVIFTNAVDAALDVLEDKISNPESNYLITESTARPVGCIFFSSETATVGRIRLFFIEHAHRGQGIGSRMLRNVLANAGLNGIETVVVSTFDRHPEACRLYESFGFEVANRFWSTAFGQTMQQLDYQISLDSTSRDQ
ncbi:Acetyltransferase (GNAT) family protein [Roseovarius albus]|uniref:Acetyltransferase (GNAT) family protein n=1 Tax=Roseovarius albus TaxID=1247867 RepID=A0A1X6YZV6_9RHOB|nr:Acetyltransferase (GNAT) family protein [Roseovarius albus]